MFYEVTPVPIHFKAVALNAQLDLTGLIIAHRHHFAVLKRKRRGELEELGYYFEERRCVHGIKLSKDFRLITAPTKRRQVVQQLPDGSVRIAYV